MARILSIQYRVFALILSVLIGGIIRVVGVVAGVRRSREVKSIVSIDPKGRHLNLLFDGLSGPGTPYRPCVDYQLQLNRDSPFVRLSAVGLSGGRNVPATLLRADYLDDRDSSTAAKLLYVQGSCGSGGDGDGDGGDGSSDGDGDGDGGDGNESE